VAAKVLDQVVALLIARDRELAKDA
jgi:hypothetical protein